MDAPCEFDSILAPPAGSVEDFDFLIGRWSVRHQHLEGRLVGSTNWVAFGGECMAQKVLGGQANIDDNILRLPGGTYRAATVRIFDPERREWSIYWIDSRYPPREMEPPVIGGFERCVGIFFSDGEWSGRRVRTRFIWRVDGPDLCRWEQAFSPDAGKSWETNWRMRFERAN